VCLPWEKTRVGFATTPPNDYMSHGVHFVTFLVAGKQQGAPAVQSDLDQWLVAVPETFDLIADPTRQALPSVDAGGGAIPTSYSVDPRTMTITDVTVGYSSNATSLPAIDALLTKNP
jgi:hypothetical protein